jgi:hypothetical protein
MNSLPITISADPNYDSALQAFVEVEANGVPVTMLLDTGAARSSVPHQAEFASLPTVGVSKSHGALGGQRPDPLVRLDSLCAGPFVSTDLVVSVEPEGWEHPPVLGMDVLGDRSCWFRFSAAVIEVDAPPPPGLLALHTGAHQMPGIELCWDGVSTRAGWDTGAGITLADVTWAKAHPDVVTILPEIGHGTDSSGVTSSGNKARIASCRIGDVTFPAQDCGLPDLSFFKGALVVFAGLPLILHVDWYMDFPGRRWCITR